MVIESEVQGILGQRSPGNSLEIFHKTGQEVSEVHLWVWKRATEVAAGWSEMKEGARGRVRLQAKRPCLGTICKIQAIRNQF